MKNSAITPEDEKDYNWTFQQRLRGDLWELANDGQLCTVAERSQDIESIIAKVDVRIRELTDDLNDYNNAVILKNNLIDDLERQLSDKQNEKQAFKNRLVEIFKDFDKDYGRFVLPDKSISVAIIKLIEAEYGDVEDKPVITEEEIEKMAKDKSEYMFPKEQYRKGFIAGFKAARERLTNRVDLL